MPLHPPAAPSLRRGPGRAAGRRRDRPARARRGLARDRRRVRFGQVDPAARDRRAPRADRRDSNARPRGVPPADLPGCRGLAAAVAPPPPPDLPPPAANQRPPPPPRAPLAWAEPVSALDVSLASQVLNLLCKLRESLGIALLFVTHDLAVARAVADEVAVVKEGLVVELAPTEEIFTAPKHPYTRELIAAVPDPAEAA